MAYPDDLSAPSKVGEPRILIHDHIKEGMSLSSVSTSSGATYTLGVSGVSKITVTRLPGPLGYYLAAVVLVDTGRGLCVPVIALHNVDLYEVSPDCPLHQRVMFGEPFDKGATA